MKKLIILFLVLSLSACKTTSVGDFINNDAPNGNQNTRIFYVSKARRGGMIYFSKVIVSKKVNNRWKTVEEIEGLELY